MVMDANLPDFIVVSGDRFRDLLSYCSRTFDSDASKWGQIFPWEFPQHATRREEEHFLRQHFSEAEIKVQGGNTGPGEGFRFLKQAWYCIALNNAEQRLPAAEKLWWEKEGYEEFLSDPEMVKLMLSPDAKTQTFGLGSAYSKLYGDKFVFWLMRSIQRTTAHRVQQQRVEPFNKAISDDTVINGEGSDGNVSDVKAHNDQPHNDKSHTNEVTNYNVPGSQVNSGIVHSNVVPSGDATSERQSDTSDPSMPAEEKPPVDIQPVVETKKCLQEEPLVVTSSEFVPSTPGVGSPLIKQHPKSHESETLLLSAPFPNHPKAQTSEAFTGRRESRGAQLPRRPSGFTKTFKGSRDMPHIYNPALPGSLSQDFYYKPNHEAVASLPGTNVLAQIPPPAFIGSNGPQWEPPHRPSIDNIAPFHPLDPNQHGQLLQYPPIAGPYAQPTVREVYNDSAMREPLHPSPGFPTHRRDSAASHSARPRGGASFRGRSGRGRGSFNSGRPSTSIDVPNHHRYSTSKEYGSLGINQAPKPHRPGIAEILWRNDKEIGATEHMGKENRTLAMRQAVDGFVSMNPGNPELNGGGIFHRTHDSSNARRGSHLEPFSNTTSSGTNHSFNLLGMPIDESQRCEKHRIGSGCHWVTKLIVFDDPRARDDNQLRSSLTRLLPNVVGVESLPLHHGKPDRLSFVTFQSHLDAINSLHQKRTWPDGSPIRLEVPRHFWDGSFRGAGSFQARIAPHGARRQHYPGSGQDARLDLPTWRPQETRTTKDVPIDSKRDRDLQPKDDKPTNDNKESASNVVEDHETTPTESRAVSRSNTPKGHTKRITKKTKKEKSLQASPRGNKSALEPQVVGNDITSVVDSAKDNPVLQSGEDAKVKDSVNTANQSPESNQPSRESTSVGQSRFGSIARKTINYTARAIAGTETLYERDLKAQTEGSMVERDNKVSSQRYAALASLIRCPSTKVAENDERPVQNEGRMMDNENYETGGKSVLSGETPKGSVSGVSETLPPSPSSASASAATPIKVAIPHARAKSTAVSTSMSPQDQGLKVSAPSNISTSLTFTPLIFHTAPTTSKVPPEAGGCTEGTQNEPTQGDTNIVTAHSDLTSIIPKAVESSDDVVKEGGPPKKSDKLKGPAQTESLNPFGKRNTVKKSKEKKAKGSLKGKPKVEGTLPLSQTTSGSNSLAVSEGDGAGDSQATVPADGQAKLSNKILSQFNMGKKGSASNAHASGTNSLFEPECHQATTSADTVNKRPSALNVFGRIFGSGSQAHGKDGKKHETTSSANEVLAKEPQSTDGAKAPNMDTCQGYETTPTPPHQPRGSEDDVGVQESHRASPENSDSEKQGEGAITARDQIGTTTDGTIGLGILAGGQEDSAGIIPQITNQAKKKKSKKRRTSARKSLDASEPPNSTVDALGLVLSRALSDFPDRPSVHQSSASSSGFHSKANSDTSSQTFGRHTPSPEPDSPSSTATVKKRSLKSSSSGHLVEAKEPQWKRGKRRESGKSSEEVADEQAEDTTDEATEPGKQVALIIPSTSDHTSSTGHTVISLRSRQLTRIFLTHAADNSSEQSNRTILILSDSQSSRDESEPVQGKVHSCQCGKYRLTEDAEDGLNTTETEG